MNNSPDVPVASTSCASPSLPVLTPSRSASPSPIASPGTTTAPTLHTAAPDVPAAIPDAHIAGPPHIPGHQSPAAHSDSSSDCDVATPSSLQMSGDSPAECLHMNPRHVPLMTPGKISPMVMWHWEMACVDYCRTNKIEARDCVAAVLSGLLDLRTQDWVATHGDQLAAR